MASPLRIFGQMENQGHQQVVFVRDSGAGLTAIIAIHSTVLGPALGGTRVFCPVAIQPPLGARAT
jgi:leucine dehydrogenase